MPPRSSPLPVCWAEVLEKINRGLERAIAATAEREQALEAYAATSPAEPAGAELAERWQTHVDALAERVERAEATATTAGTALEAEAAAARTWAETAGEMRQKLAEWAGRSVR